MLILNAEDVERALPMQDAIDAMREAFSSLSNDQALVPPRCHMNISAHAGICLVMPAFVGGSEDEQALAVKTVSLFDGNQQRGLARIQAAVTLFEADTGRPLALLDGGTLTAIRTAAAPGLATDVLARKDARQLAVFGAGVQARQQILAMCQVRPVDVVRLFTPTRAKADALIADLLLQFPGISWEVVDSPREAVQQADIICCASTAKYPVFSDTDVRPGTHINAIGSFQPEVAEVPAETVCRARTYVDSVDAAWEEAGDLIQPLRSGLIDRDHLVGEVGALAQGKIGGRQDDSQVTLFKSVGIAAQDAVAARVAVTNARKQAIGQTVDW